MNRDENKSWEPDQILFNALIEMGIDSDRAEEALFCTGNSSVELATAYLYGRPLFEQLQDEDEETERDFEQIPELEKPENIDESCELAKSIHTVQSNESPSHLRDVDDYKMVCIVNTAVKMGVGKLAAQVAHACLGLYRELSDDDLQAVELYQWIYSGEKTVVLKGKGADHLEELYDKAKEMKIPCYLVRDAGRTQIPENSVTVLSIFGVNVNVNKISGSLSLL